VAENFDPRWGILVSAGPTDGSVTKNKVVRLREYKQGAAAVEQAWAKKS